MRPAKRFGVLHKAAKGRLAKLRGLAVHSLSTYASDFSYCNAEISFVTIELQSLLSNFCRSYYLSAVLHPCSEGGTRVTCHHSISSFDAAIDAAMKACKPSWWRPSPVPRHWNRRDEPPWHQPDTLLKSSREISHSYYSNISAALSLPTSVFSHLVVFRNFFAHRSDSTCQEAINVAIRHYSIFSKKHPVSILLAPALGRPQELILDWIDDVTNVIELLCL